MLIHFTVIFGNQRKYCGSETLQPKKKRIFDDWSTENFRITQSRDQTRAKVPDVWKHILTVRDMQAHYSGETNCELSTAETSLYLRPYIVELYDD